MSGDSRPPRGRGLLGRGVGALALMLLLGGALWGEALGAEPSKEEQRAEIRTTAREILARLYEVQPGARTAIEKAAGYAVFSSFGMKLGVAGTGRGKGVAVNQATKRETFMKMLEIQAGLGLGIKRFQLVWVFASPQALDQFTTSGRELGAQSTASAKAGGQGAAWQGAVSVAPDVWLYQLTDKGLALELTAKGTKYFTDEDLN